MRPAGRAEPPQVEHAGADAAARPGPAGSSRGRARLGGRWSALPAWPWWVRGVRRSARLMPHDGARASLAGAVVGPDLCATCEGSDRRAPAASAMSATCAVGAARASRGRRAAPASRTTLASRSGSTCPAPRLACRSAPESNSSRLSLQCTRSMRPVILRTSSTIGLQRVAAGVRVAGVEAEPDQVEPLGRRDRLPHPGDPVEVAGHRVGAAGGVLDEQRELEVGGLDGLAPVVEALGRVVLVGHVAAVHDQPLGADLGRGVDVLLEQLAARDPHPVVGRGDVDEVGRVHVEVDARGLGVGLERPRRRRRSRTPVPCSPAGRRGRTAPAAPCAPSPRRSGRSARRGLRGRCSCCPL